ncbi:MAG: TA system VapC family ribonuclease toxin [Cellulomonadaceae bacterium]
MTTHLLDANVLIALTVAEHEHHTRAARWAAGVTSFAVCPVVEGALTRFLVRVGETHLTASATLRAIRERPGYSFWPDCVSYADADLTAVRGHRQVTDAYLAALTRTHRSARLATLDEGLVAMAPDVAFLLPAI